MTFKEYIQTKKGKVELKNYLKKHPDVKRKIKKILNKKKHALPQSPHSRHPHSGNMGTTGYGTGADSAQPSLS